MPLAQLWVSLSIYIYISIYLYIQYVSVYVYIYICIHLYINWSVYLSCSAKFKILWSCDNCSEEVQTSAALPSGNFSLLSPTRLFRRVFCQLVWTEGWRHPKHLFPTMILSHKLLWPCRLYSSDFCFFRRGSEPGVLQLTSPETWLHSAQLLVQIRVSFQLYCSVLQSRRLPWFFILLLYLMENLPVASSFCSYTYRLLESCPHSIQCEDKVILYWSFGEHKEVRAQQDKEYKAGGDFIYL